MGIGRPLPFMFVVTFCVGILASVSPTSAAAVRNVDQGANWSPQTRARYYAQDQGSQLIPYLWLSALRQADGRPFLDGALARYGYLPQPSSPLPIGFTSVDSDQGRMVGMTCAACHTRDINVGGVTYRIDGGPAFADFAAFVGDLDAAVGRVLDDDATFRSFAAAVLGARAGDPTARDTLHVEVELWSVRFHTLMNRALPKERKWGPARLDAIAMIFDRVAGLDLGVAPTYLIPENIQRADAPARYPFLWNSSRQDRAQWSGFAENGNDSLALARNLGQVYGVFATFHPKSASSQAVMDRDYLSDNSASLTGLQTNEALIARLAPPVWPWPIDAALAARGRAIFDRPAAAGGCADCHAVREGEPRPPEMHTLRTVVADAGTDTRQWEILTRRVKTGSLAGASIPGVMPPLGATDYALQALKTAVLGALVEAQPPQQEPDRMRSTANMPMTHDQMAETMKLTSGMSMPIVNVYEARALQGIWAAAPYLHNGSVPTLSDLLKPPAERPARFAVGPAYDISAVGLSVDQGPRAFVLTTTGCEDRRSGDSRCGHDYGTRLPAADKKALIEYLKTI